jgi:hypothetical protein
MDRTRSSRHFAASSCVTVSAPLSFSARKLIFSPGFT